MPGQFLTKAEREQLSSFPPHPTEDDLIIFFRLTASDLNLINKRTGDYNRLGCALQLGTLRYLGFVPDDIQTAPSAIIDYLAQQLQVNPSCLIHFICHKIRGDTFKSHQASAPLIQALNLLRELDATNKRKIPHDAPQDFIAP